MHFRDYSVLIRWGGKAPFNGTIDAISQLTRSEAKGIANIFCGHKNSFDVDIIRCVDGERTFKNIKESGKPT